MTRSICLGLLILLLAGTVALAGSGTKWLHIKVNEGGENGEMVRLNLPLDLVAQVLPLVKTEAFDRGKVTIDGEEFEEVDIRGILAAVRDAEDGEYVTVDGPDENVRVSKHGNLLLVNVKESGGDDEEVKIRIRMEVVEALLSGDDDELNILAAVNALGEYDDGDLVTVDGDDETVRIWIDSQNTSD